MSITRRHFILGTSAGLILPSYYTKALSFLDSHGVPFLEAPANTQGVLYAVDQGANSFELCLGSPEFVVPDMTLEEFAGWRGQSLQEYVDELNEIESENWGVDEDFAQLTINDVDWNELADPVLVSESFGHFETPAGRSYEYLSELDLGPDLGSKNGVGDLSFYDGQFPGNDYFGVYANDAVTVSLLQQRLNDLGENVRIEVA